MGYGLSNATDCRETKAGLKASIKERKRAMEEFISLTNRLDMNWEARAQTVGSIAMDIRSMKIRLRSLKRKRNVKK